MKLAYYCHPESDSLFIEEDGGDIIGDGFCEKIGEVKERTLEELVTYLHNEGNEYALSLINDKVISQLELK